MSNERGFTLAEMLVVCAIVGLVMASLLGLVMAGQQAYWFGTTQVDAQQTVRVAIERMVKEVREAGYYPRNPDTTSCAAPPCYPFNAIGTGATSSTLTLQYDWSGDGTSAASGTVTDPILNAARGERVTYSFSSGTLTRQETGVDGTPLTLATGISALAFSYFDEDGLATTTPADIRTVAISVTAQTASKGAYVTMTDRVRLRNR
jgi:prepilin-type N-terminal cleavage/methylation domain-containing protein